MDEQRRGFVVGVGRAVAPVVVHGDTRFPGKGVALGVQDAGRRDDALGRYEVAVIGRGVARCERSVALARDLEAIVGDDLRLQLAHHAHELGCAPGFAAHFHAVDGRVVGKIEPQQVELAIIGAQLAHLLVHVVEVAVEIASIVATRYGVVAQRGLAIAVLGEVGMVPVDDRVVQAYF